MRHLPLMVVLASLTFAQPAIAQMSSQERQRLVAHLDMTSAWLLDEVNGLSPAQLSFRPAAGAWSIAEVLDHLVVVGPIYWDDLQSAVKAGARAESPARRSTNTDADILWYGIDRTFREKAIPTELPAPKPRDLRSAIEQYRDAHRRLLNYVKTTSDDLRRSFVPRQGSDGYQWALLISTHEQRHVLQIREIKASSGFPPK